MFDTQCIEIRGLQPRSLLYNLDWIKYYKTKFSKLESRPLYSSIKQWNHKQHFGASIRIAIKCECQ